MLPWNSLALVLSINRESCQDRRQANLPSRLCFKQQQPTLLMSATAYTTTTALEPSLQLPPPHTPHLVVCAFPRRHSPSKLPAFETIAFLFFKMKPPGPAPLSFFVAFLLA